MFNTNYVNRLNSLIAQYILYIIFRQTTFIFLVLCVSWRERLVFIQFYNMLSATRVVKLFFVVSLFLIFLFLFGKPSLEKYIKKDTIFVESKVKFDTRNPPAVTLLSAKTHLFLDLQECLAKQSYDSVIACYNQHFLKKTQLLQPSTFGNFTWSLDIPFGD